ncbi:MAG: ABC transporter ATP-binding protein [bacterium]|nr:ABC transporter ATP-binding protein [bacterium]
MVTFSNISRKYSKNGGSEVRALDDVSLEIGKGSFVAIIGPSGSGKSTMMNIMGLLDRPTSGTYQLDGQSVDSITGDDLAAIRNQKIGFVFQSFHLLPRTTARENVELPLIYSDNSAPGISSAEALKAVGLEKRMDHYPSEMSGGEQQRVAIARALINDPEIIFADEPTGNLDSRSGEEIMNIFRDLHRSGKTIVLITHDSDIAKCAQRVIQISDGKITSDEPTPHRKQKGHAVTN